MIVAAFIDTLAGDLAAIVDSLDGLQEQRRISRNERVEIEQCAVVPQERPENVGFRKTVGSGTPHDLALSVNIRGITAQIAAQHAEVSDFFK